MKLRICTWGNSLALRLPLKSSSAVRDLMLAIQCRWLWLKMAR